MTNPGEFLSKATGFIKNPLGIVGLFIALIYGVAVVVAGASPRLTQDQRSALIVFAVVFPNFVLVTFYLLVTRHHQKLYAPTDWRDERHFFGPQTEAIRQVKEAEELQLIAPGAAQEPDAAADHPPLIPRVEGPTAVPATRQQLLQAAREATDLAFDALADEFGGQAYRDVMVQRGDRRIGLDGAIVRDGVTTFVEIKFIRDTRLISSAIDQGLLTLVAAGEAIRANESKQEVEYCFVVVSEKLSGDERKRVQERVFLRVRRFGIPMLVRVFVLADLRAEVQEA